MEWIMTRKHFEAIAAILSDTRAAGYDGETVSKITAELANWLMTQNERFDVDRFCDAAM